MNLGGMHESLPGAIGRYLGMYLLIGSQARRFEYVTMAIF